MTKDTDEFSQFTESVTCREYTLPRDEKSSDPKVWIRGNTKIGPVLEVTTSYLQGKYGVEIRNESVNKDNSHSWVRISHGFIKLVTDLSYKEQDDNEQESSEMQFEEFALKLNVLAFASRSKAKAKPPRRISASSSTKTVPIGERTWTDIEPQDYSTTDYPVSKKLINLLRHGHLLREEDGAIEFWRLKDYLRNEFEYSQYWSDDVWKSKMAKVGGNKKRFQYCTDPSGELFKVIQDAISLILHYRTMCWFRTISSSTFITLDVQSVYTPSSNSGLIAGGQNLSNRQTVFFLPVDPMGKEHKDPETVDLKAPRLAWYKQKTWKKHQNTLYWVDVRLAQKKILKFYQTRSNANILW